jgi:hypothetical protein
MIKTLSFCILLLSTLSGVYLANDTSGLKFGIDTNFFKVLEKIDLNKFAKNKTLIASPGISLKSSSFPSYDIQIRNLSITDIKNPKSVLVNSINSGSNDLNTNATLAIIMTNFEINLQTDYDIKMMSIFTDHAVASPIKIVLDSVNGEFFFNQGNVVFKKLDVKIGEIDFKFNSFWFKMVYAIAKSFVIKGINKEVSTLYGKISDALNQFISSQVLIDVGMGIGINATNVDRPKLELIKKTEIRNSSIDKFSELSFLSEEGEKNYNFNTNSNENTILEFGIHGSLYPNASPDLKPSIAPAVKMNYVPSTFNNKLTMLLSDYTINTLFFMIQQTGAVKFVYNNDTASILPFHVDTQGVSSIIPEFNKKYPNNTAMEIKLYITPFGFNQPLLDTDSDGSKLSMNFGIDFNVISSPNPWDDPVTELKLNVTSHIKFQFLVSENKLSIIYFKFTIDNEDVAVDGLNVDKEKMKTSVEGLLNKVLDSFKKDFSNIDVLAMLHKQFGLDFNNLIVETNSDYSIFSVDINNL